MDEQHRQFLTALGDAYEEQASDPEFQREHELWNVTVGDGLDTRIDD